MRQMITEKRQSYWDLRAAGNFIGGGTGVGLMLWSALALGTGSNNFIPLALGLGSLSLGLSLVWFEIGKPWRALNVFFHPQTSWMTREGILAGPILASGAAAFWLESIPLTVLTAFLGLVFLYCQGRILKASKAIPAWSNPNIMPLIIFAGLTEGAGMFLVFGSPPIFIAIITVVLGVIFEVFYQRYIESLKTRKAPTLSLACLTGKIAKSTVALRLSGLIIISLGFAGFENMWPIGGGLLALSGWIFKSLLITKAAYTRGAAIPFTPTRGRSKPRVVNDTA